MKLRAYIAALHAALFAILLAVSPADSGSMTLLGAGKPAAGGGGAVTFSATSGPQAPTNGGSASWNHVVGAGDTAVVICIGALGTTGNETITAASFGGQNILPSVIRAGDNTLTGSVAYILGLTNLGGLGLTGTQTVSITWSASMTNMLGTSMSVTGSNNSTLFSNSGATTGTAGQNNTSPTLNVTSATGELVFDFVYFGNTTSTITGPQSAVAENMANGTLHGSASRSAGAATVTPTYTIGANGWIMVGASFKQ